MGSGAGRDAAGRPFRSRGVAAAEAALAVDRMALVFGDAAAGGGNHPSGHQAHADRYTYLPQIGIYLARDLAGGGVAA